jgi:hypothetical protein
LSGCWIDTTFRDVIHGWRILWRRPALFLSAVLLIALISGAVALTGLADRIQLRPISVKTPERLVQVIRPAGPTGFQPKPAKSAALTDDAFMILGVQADLGRLFTSRDSNFNADPVLVISHDYWQRRFSLRLL